MHVLKTISETVVKQVAKQVNEKPNPFAIRNSDRRNSEGTKSVLCNNVLHAYSVASAPAADKGSGVTILGCKVSSPYVFVSKWTPPPSFLRRIIRVISQMEWRPLFEVAAKRKRDWLEALRKVDGLAESSGETALKCLLSDKSGKKFPHEYLAFIQHFLFLSLEYPRLSCFWVTPSIPRSLRSPTFSSL